MKLTPEQWKEIMDRPETQEAIQQFVIAYHQRERDRILKDLHPSWWFAAIGWTVVVTLPVGIVYVIERILL